jgi:putative ABC transport system permease protein
LVESDAGVAPPPTIILGYNFWQRTFNGDPRIVGKTVRIGRSDTPPTVIGVMPPGVRFLPSPRAAKEPNDDLDAQVDFWVPVIPDPARRKRPSRSWAAS